jgi:methylmalonyl-CoA mutase C-terminal domain/subunit
MPHSAENAGPSRRIRIVLAKPGLDGHDVGAKVVARALRDAGFEVIYTGLRQTPESVCRIALEEDADVIALSSMAGSHVSFCERLAPLLDDAGLRDKLWIVGGNLPAMDHARLRELGFRGVFPTGSTLASIVEYIRDECTGAWHDGRAGEVPGAAAGAVR